MCSVVTNLVASQEFKPIRCATTLCHFGRSRSGYVVTHFILLSRTAESSATSGYVVVPERYGQNEGQACRKEEWARKKPGFFPSSGFKRCNMKTHVNMNLTHLLYVFFLCVFLVYSSSFFFLWKTFLITYLCYYFLCRREKNHFDVHFWLIGPVLFGVERWERRDL